MPLPGLAILHPIRRSGSRISSKVFIPEINGGIPEIMRLLAAGLTRWCRSEVLVSRVRGPGGSEIVEGIEVYRAGALKSVWSLEAMASGTPMLASATGSILEVVGNAGLLVDPHDDVALAEGLERILTDHPLREACIATGIERTRRFTWTSCVDRTLSLYRELQAG
jgi:glycosyltransferase involved in cell wall biosynthesis